MSHPEQRVVAGRYRLRRLLGRGSMGTVWEAYDELLHRLVAVKEVLLPPGIPESEADELRERTLREARAIAVVSHPNVITLHDVAREDGEPFVVMEYMPARSLAEVLRDGPLDEPRAAAVGYAVAAGLAAAHQAGITHRDVKPGNVLVAGDGRVKLTDFGIARNVSELTMTRTGITLGSPAYIAPEVAAGREVTPAADLWGLGATLFAAVEGRPPYDPNGPVLETLSAVIHGEVPAPTTSGPLRDVITALMVKDPTGRAPLDEVRTLLHPLLPSPGTPLYETSATDEPAALDTPASEPVPEPVPAEPAKPPSVPALAADPGPLPFRTPSPAPPTQRGAVASALVLVTAIVLFLLAAGGGFALARTIGGQALLPPARVTPTQPADTPLGEFAVVSGDASTLAGEQGGGFSVPVPHGWTKFVQQRITKLPNSTRVHFVSPDGTQQLTVERYPSFYPKLEISRYLAALEAESPDYQEVAIAAAENVTAATGPEPAEDLTYKTTDLARGLDPGSNRVTFARLLPSGIDLWVVSVTVPIEQEDTGRAKLFDMIVPEFKVTG